MTDKILQDKYDVMVRIRWLIVNIKYLRYIIIHKYWVFRYCCLMGIPIRGLLHDLSKFRKDEWVPYRDYFYSDKTGELEKEAFDIAWLKHIHRNPHHWQYWCLLLDDGGQRLLEMPFELKLEMIADWMGASKALGGNVIDWYDKNKDKILLHEFTRECVEIMIEGLRSNKLAREKFSISDPKMRTKND